MAVEGLSPKFAGRAVSPLEIILPVRNPPAAFRQSVESLAAQTDRNFSVLISDNGSGSGQELMREALQSLQGAGIPARKVSPPIDLGRVEHWNWAMRESEAVWLKPLFAGDWLEPAYVATLRRAMTANPSCRYIFCNYLLHPGSNEPRLVKSPWAGRYRSAAQMQRLVLGYGMQFGPPSAAAYEREAFLSIGGYATTLPICADSLTFCTLAARFGCLGLADPLCHFNIHDARFSTSLPGRRKDNLREALIYFAMLGYAAWSGRIPVPKTAFALMFARQLRAYFAQPA